MDKPKRPFGYRILLWLVVSILAILLVLSFFGRSVGGMAMSDVNGTMVALAAVAVGIVALIALRDRDRRRGR